MQERTCPTCGRIFDSAAQELDWICPHCGEIISVNKSKPLCSEMQISDCYEYKDCEGCPAE